ncbi:anti-sigma factor antagonist [Nonomuraea sp. NPDC049709]|uniref:anti-sigma factor antagonist n=1 Tax=Nonomuraea sp. NPDC049709 TaxID=3154736 RepID=UPI00342221DC
MTDDLREERDSLTLHCPITADLALLRARLRDFATIAGLSGPRLDDLIIAVNEATGNVLVHGGAGTLTARADAVGVQVDVIDDAGTLTAGHLDRMPDPATHHGFGLYVIRKLCDEVQLDHPAGRSRLRLSMRYAPATSPEESGPRSAPAGPKALRQAALASPRPDAAARKDDERMPPLTLGHRHLPGITIITLTGELDATNAEQLQTFIRQCRQTPADELIFDLAGLHFIDSTGLRVLLDASTEALGHGGQVHLAAPHDMPARLLDVTGVSLGLPIHDSLTDALDAATPPPSGTTTSTP